MIFLAVLLLLCVSCGVHAGFKYNGTRMHFKRYMEFSKAHQKEFRAERALLCGVKAVEEGCQLFVFDLSTKQCLLYFPEVSHPGQIVPSMQRREIWILIGNQLNKALISEIKQL